MESRGASAHQLDRAILEAMNMRLFDYFTIGDDSDKVRTTNDGYLVATPRVARTGVQLYYGSELGMTGADANKIFKINRPEEEVFKTDSLATYGFKPVTDDHPPKEVTAETWKDYARGQVGGEVLRDNEFIRVPMAVMDARTIKKIDGGKVEISVGYDCEIEMTPGTLKDGTAFDGSQKNIRVNHVAIVDAARGGAKLRFGDTSASLPEANKLFTGDQIPGSTKREELSMRVIMIDGISVNVENDQAAQIIDRHIASLTSTVTDAKKQVADLTASLSTTQQKLDAAVATAATDKSKSEAEIATLKKQLDESKVTPAMLDAMVKERTAITGKARAILGDKLVVDGKGATEIMRQVVDAKMGDAAKGWNDEQVKISFDSLTAGVKPVESVVNAADQLGAVFSSAPVTHDANDARAKADAAYEAKAKRLEDAWKGPTAGAA